MLINVWIQTTGPNVDTVNLTKQPMRKITVGIPRMKSYPIAWSKKTNLYQRIYAGGTNIPEWMIST